MKKLGLIISVFIIACASTCKKDDDCHKIITVQNNSDSTVIISTVFTDVDGNCVLSGESKESGNNYTFDIRSCWEDRLSDGRAKEIYIVAPSNFNNEGFYPCDSIEFNNTVLRKYELSIEDLKASNFVINFP